MTSMFKTRFKSVAAASFGNALEWYDFGVYTFVAGILSKAFFPPGDDAAALLATFAVFGLGFVVRPIGAAVLGRLGDVIGRKTPLVITMGLMGLGTLAIGFIPTYASIGIWAPILLVSARLVQSFSVGGEFTTSITYLVEWAPPEKRGFYGSLQQCGTNVGLLLGSGLAALASTLLDAQAMASWGWRVLFILGGLTGFIGLYMRRHVDETPVFQEARLTPHAMDEPRKKLIGLAFKAYFLTTLGTTAFFVFLFYMPTFTQRYAHLSSTAALWSNSAGLLTLAVGIPISGYLSDRIGRKPLLILGFTLVLLLAYPLFYLLGSGIAPLTVLMVQILIGFIMSLYTGPSPATLVELFPTRARSTYMAIGYTMATATFGGFAPFIATWLISYTGSPLAPTFYVMLAAVISLATAVSLRETAHEPLK